MSATIRCATCRRDVPKDEKVINGAEGPRCSECNERHNGKAAHVQPVEKFGWFDCQVEIPCIEYGVSKKAMARMVLWWNASSMLSGWWVAEPSHGVTVALNDAIPNAVVRRAEMRPGGERFLAARGG